MRPSGRILRSSAEQDFQAYFVRQARPQSQLCHHKPLQRHRASREEKENRPKAVFFFTVYSQVQAASPASWRVDLKMVAGMGSPW